MKQLKPEVKITVDMADQHVEFQLDKGQWSIFVEDTGLPTDSTLPSKLARAITTAEVSTILALIPGLGEVNDDEIADNDIAQELSRRCLSLLSQLMAFSNNLLRAASSEE